MVTFYADPAYSTPASIVTIILVVVGILVMATCDMWSVPKASAGLQGGFKFRIYKLVLMSRLTKIRFGLVR